MSSEEYIESHSSPENEVLTKISRETNLHVLNPHMLSGQVQGRVLSFLSKMIRPKRILELGTFTGYSALCLAEGLTEDGELVTIEHNDELEDVIRRNLALSPLNSKICLIISDAKEYLTAQRSNSEAVCQHNGLPGGPGLYDLIFIDADKREYCQYYELVFDLVRHGGWILADNTLWDGHIIDSAYDRDKQTLGLRAFNDLIAADERVEKVILPLRDGLTIIHKL